ncbi:MAG: DNA polymerase III subunit [Bdellovibrionota bacterium]
MTSSNGTKPLAAPLGLIDFHAQTLATRLPVAGQVPQAILLTGPKGVGKKQMAHWLATRLCCTGGGGGDTLQPCGSCPTCRKATGANWVDFTWLGGEDSPLGVEDIRALQAQTRHSAHESRYRIFLLTDADRMGAAAANAFLKLLEEPPAGWVFLLTASDVTLVLPTILSRCPRRVSLKPVPDAILAKLLLDTDIPAERHAACVEAAEGSWWKALEIGRDETWKGWEKISLFVESPAPHLNGLVDWASADPRNLELLCERLERLSLDRGWTDRGIAMSEARRYFDIPLNRKLQIQELLVPFLGRRT